MYEQVETSDGSLTLFNDNYGETYHSNTGALEETEKKFIDPILPFTKKSISVLDVGFGLGLNCFILLKKSTADQIVFHSYEKDKVLLEKLDVSLYDNVFIENSFIKHFLNSLKENLNTNSNEFCIEYDFENTKVIHNFYIGDARSFEFPKTDICFLDAFSSKNNVELWTLDFLKKIKSDYLLTYSSALPVLNALKQLDYNLYEVTPVGRKRGSLLASKKVLDLKIYPNLDLLKSKSAIVYRDVNLNASGAEIHDLQRKEQENSLLPTLSKLKKGLKDHRN